MSVIDEILAERVRQTEKWGEQSHPDGSGRVQRHLADYVFTRGAWGTSSVANATALQLSLMAKEVTDTAAKNGQVTWTDILLEEVFEALAEDDPARLRAELVQVAAVAAQWVEAIDRRVGGEVPC